MKTDGIGERRRRRRNWEKMWCIKNVEAEMVMKRSNATNSLETSQCRPLALFLSLSLYLYGLFLETAPLQIKALNQNLSKSRMLRAMSFTPNATHTHTHKKPCDHVSVSSHKSYLSWLIESHHVLINMGVWNTVKCTNCWIPLWAPDRHMKKEIIQNLIFLTVLSLFLPPPAECF